MFKKNQLALILLTLVMMLTVYYIKSPKKVDSGLDDTPVSVVTGRLEPLAVMRTAVKSERSEVIASLNAIIANENSTTTEINSAIEQKNSLNQLTENELLLELKIINLGYQDSFVHATNNGIDITVVADEHSVTKANEIIIMAMLEFNENFSNVCVEFETVSEVMGTTVNE